MILRRKVGPRLSFALGGLIGVVLTALVAVLVVPLFDAAPGLESGRLVILSGKDQSDGKQRQELVNQWNVLNPGNQAVIEELSAGADDQYSEMVGRAQTAGADADIFNLDVAWTAEFAHAEYIAPLDEDGLDVSGFLPKPLETCKYDGKLWCLPFNTDAGLLYFQNAVGKAPVDWDGMVQETRRVFANPHGPELQAGYTTQLEDYEGLVVNALEAIWAANGEVVDKDCSVVIDSAEARRGLERLAEGLRSTDPRLILPEARTQDENRSTMAFAEGKVLFMRNWPVAYRTLQRKASDDATKPTSFQVAKLPGPSVLGGQNLAVSSKSTKPKAARALIEFLTSPRSQQLLFERGGFAATRDIVYLDAEVQKQYPYAQTLLESIRRAKLRPVTRNYVRFAEAFRGVVKESLANDGRLPADATARLTAALCG